MLTAEIANSQKKSIQLKVGHLSMEVSPLYNYILYHIVSSRAEHGAYSVSKIGVNRLTELLAEKITTDANPPGVLINAVN